MLFHGLQISDCFHKPSLSCRSLRRTLPAPRKGMLKSFFALALCGFCVCLLQRSTASFVQHSKEKPQPAELMYAGPNRKTTLAAMPSTAVQEKVESDENFRVLTLTLLQRVGNAESIMEAGEMEGSVDGALDFNEFLVLLQKVDLDCDRNDAKRLFDMIDSDGGGSIDVQEMRDSLRNSGTISEMYAEGFNNFGKVLVLTAGVGAAIAVSQGLPSALDFATGFFVEDSLSVDNLFVFLILFRYFKVPPSLQTYCLNLGIYGAVILRAICIFAGLLALKSFQPLLLVFAAFLIYSSYEALKPEDEDDDDDDEPPEIVQEILKNIPTTDKFDGEKLFAQDDSGKWLATPLLLCILSVELSDVLFAVDSIPAVFGVTEDPIVVFTSNICAILGLRSLYQVLSIAAQDFIYLEKAVAVVLGFVGVKLCAEVAGYEVSSAMSLIFILTVLGIGIGASKLAEEEGQVKPKKSTIEKIYEGLMSIFK